MKIISKIEDKRINALNVLLEMTIGEYLSVANDIIKNNEFQRKRVRGASTVYSLLKKDLRRNCTIPPIVLAVKVGKMNSFSEPKELSDGDIIELFTAQNLIILDGLQRSFQLIELEDELQKEGDKEALARVLNNRIRIEVYLGLNKIGILYRMLTLNTGQTPMSTRHQIEILYSDYLDNTIENISLFKETETRRVTKIGEYQFKDAVEGFYSYLERDELGMNRSDLLENIQNLEKLALENTSVDLFKDYIVTYTKFVTKIDAISDNWSLEEVESKKFSRVFGKNILQIFSKVQVLAGFGAAIGKLKHIGVIVGFSTISDLIDIVEIKDNVDDTMLNMLDKLDEIGKIAKKIGVDQRVFFTYFFRELFNKNSDSYLDVNKAIDSGYNKYYSLM